MEDISKSSWKRGRRVEYVYGNRKMNFTQLEKSEIARRKILEYFKWA